MTPPWRAYASYLHLHRALKVSHDATALTDVLAHLVGAAGLDREQASRAAIYAALTRDLAVTCTLLTDRAAAPEYARAAAAPFLDAARSCGGIAPLIAEQLTGDPEDDHTSVTSLIASLMPPAIRTARTVTDTLGRCAGWDLVPAPPALTLSVRAGLGRLVPSDFLFPAAPAEEEEMFARLVRDTARSCGHEDGQGLDAYAVADTLTCLHRLHDGSYYIGLRIDKMQADLIRAPHTALTAQAWASRAAVLPHRYLGEKGGWYGPIPERREIYRTTGRLAVRRAPA